MKNCLRLFALFIVLASSLPGMAANRYWIASGSANWNNAANWSATSGGTGGASIPGTADIANFNSLGPGNCTIVGTVSISGLVVDPGYTATISQSANPFTISGAATFAGGTFIGSASTMTLGGTVNLSGTAFTFPATINMNGGAWTYTAGTLDPLTNNSTVIFGSGLTLTGTQTLNHITFNNTTPWPMTYTLGTGTTLTANGNMSMVGTQALNFSGGTLNLLGNLGLNNTGTGGGGSTVLAFAGTGNQAITGSPALNQSNLPSVNINKASGTLTFPALLSSGGNTWTYSTGTVDASTNNSTVAFVGNITITGNHTLNHIQFDNSTPWAVIYTVTTGTVLTANGNLTLSGTAAQMLNNGTLNVLGNLKLSNTATGGGGSAVIGFTGTGSQSILSSLPINQGALPSVNINKASGTLTLPAIVTMGGTNWTYTTGTIDATTNNSTVVFGGNTTITGSHTLNNIHFTNTTPWGMVYTFAAGTALTAAGNVTTSGASAITFSGGTVNLLGNLVLTNTSTGDGGTTYFAFTGTGNQAITSSLPIYQGALPAVNINKASGTLTLPAIVTMAGSNWTYTTGTIDATTNNSTLVFAGNITITGSHTLNNIHFTNTTPWGMVSTFATGTVLTGSGNMTISGGSSINLNGGTINLLGNLSLTNSSTGDGGTTYISFAGTGNQAITSSLPINQGALPSVNINKASGTLTLPALLTMAGSNWTYTTGTIDAATNNSTVVFGGYTTITGSHTLNNIHFTNATPRNITFNVATGTVLTASGNMTMSGASAITLNTGTINLQGNLVLTNTSTGDGGTTVIAFTGTGNQAITSSLPANQNSLPSIGINKPSGTLSLPNLITVAGATWTYTAGTVDAASATSTVEFTGSNTIKGAGMSFYNLTVSSSTSSLGNALTVSNNLSITSPGVLSPGTNTINLAGNWNNWGNAGFTEATSIVNFNGAANQTITTPGGELFASVTTNKATGNLQLVNNTAISKTLTMTQGNIDLNGNTLTLGVNATNPGTMAYTAGTIVGAGSFTRWLKTGVVAAGSAAGLFPVGTTADGRPFSVSAPTTGPSTGGTITLSYTDGSSTNNVSFPDGASTVYTRKNLYWALSTGNGLAGGSYNLGISGPHYGMIANVNDLRLTLVGSVVGTAGVNGGTTANPQVNRTGLTAANLNNTFYLSSINPTTTTLPIQLISFTANPGNGQVLLNWSTAVEINSDYFTIQRSTDGSLWDDLQTVAAAGNSNTTAGYAAVDRLPLDGLSYYRLKMTDRDGDARYSAMVVVRYAKNVAGIRVYPNPAVNYIEISFSNPDSYTLNLLNEAGQIVDVKLAANTSNLVWNVSNRNPGVYFIQIRSQGGRSETRKIIITR